ncbi:hypothetical protein [Alteriqipengyuania sp. 357]
MTKQRLVYAALAPALAVMLAGCADMGTGGGGLAGIGTYQELRNGPGPDENTVAVLTELRENDRRIDTLRDTGQLTKRQARALRREQGRIGLLASTYDNDGVVSDDERREMETVSRVLQDQANATALQNGWGKKPEKKRK